MKVKFTLQRAEGPVDLIATVDSATTIGELADYLSSADPAASVAAVQASPKRSGASRGRSLPSGPLTLGLVEGQQLALDPRQPVVESKLRSGSIVSISVGGEVYSDPQRAVAAVVSIIEGPDAGKEFALPVGSSLVGRDSGCDVTLTDSLISRRHARINVTDSVEIVDCGSANGILLDDVAVPRSILTNADVVQIGDTRLTVRLNRTATTPESAAGPVLGHVRSPRVMTPFHGENFQAPEPPERSRPQRFPVVGLLAPLLMGAVLYFVTGNVNSLIFIALSPLMLIGNNVEQRFSRKGDYKRSLAEFNEDVDSLLADIQASAVTEATVRLAEHPSAAECASAIQEASPLLWARRPADSAFGQLRLGLGRQASRSVIELPRLKRSIRALFTELAARLERFRNVEDVPVVGDLNVTALGLAGPRSLVLGVARGLLVQLMGLHSPAELVVAVISSAHTAADWDWLKWAPHTSSAQSPVSARQLTASTGMASALIAELEDLISRREAESRKSSRLTSLVAIVESDAPAEHSRLVELAERGPTVGIYVIWIATEVAALPAACTVFLDIPRPGANAVGGFVHQGLVVSPIVLEELDADTTMGLARTLAPVVDLSARSGDVSDLPRAVSLLALAGTELATSSEAVVERWTESRSIITGPKAPPTPPKHAGSLRAILGQTGSDVHALDLRADGPHALVGGTTGAGKSELLQSWIMGMAIAHSPQRLTFLLVDYKGGSAFRDCVDLPHTVGLVTDLSPHLVRRALTSLSAELRHREHLLARHAAKDLVTLERRGVVDAPPSLVIVVDEFAALVSEVPEFVDGVVNVAQRGRSLGLHLILATQRPAGVIKDNLRANTNLRLALRMADETDSSDVLGSPEAAFFDPAIPGRAVSKTGPGRLVPFQTAYAGGWSSDVTPRPEIHVEELSLAATTTWTRAETDTVVDAGKTDIRLVVDRIVEACEDAQIKPPRKPWLPELGSVYDLADQDKVRSRRFDTELVFGLRDDPETQSQPTVAFHPDRDGNLAVYGTGGSGKSTLLRTIAVAAGFTVRGGPCQIFGIDFGARGLAMLEPLPHVGSIIPGGDHERITRLLGWLRGLIDERAARYSKVNAGTITAFRTLAKAPTEARIILLVDGLAAMRSAYESSDRLRWFDVFTSIVAEGRPVGVHVVLSSDQRAGLSTALSASVQARVVLRMASGEDYNALGVPTDVIAPAAEPGRGVMAGSEVQVAVLGGTQDQVAQAQAILTFAEAMRRNGAPEAPSIKSLPEVIELEGLPERLGDAPVIGVSSDSLGPAPFAASGTFLVSGPPMSGRTTALHTLALALLRQNPSTCLHYFGNSRSVLLDLLDWTTIATLADAPEVATRLHNTLVGGPASAIFLENVAEFVGTPADVPLQALVKLAIAEGQFVVLEGESSSLSGSMGLLGLAKTSRAGLALAPDQGDGVLFRTAFPRMNANERLPGRGLLVRGGRTETIQVARTTVVRERT